MRALLIALFIFTAATVEGVGRLEIFKAYHEGKSFLDVAGFFLPESPHLLEAGAHNGESSVILLQQWPKASLFAFEPNPIAFQRLQEVAAVHPNIFPFELALFDFNGQAPFYVQTKHGNDGASSLLEHNPDPKFKDIYTHNAPILVTCKTLDTWADENGVDHIDFMWLDMEGVELQMLRASPKILKTVKVIYTETNFQKTRLGMTQYKELHTFLTKNGFDIVYHQMSDATQTQGDALFVKKELLR